MIEDQPLISVIVPVFNVRPYISSALDCICSQTYPSLEILVVDDGSTDGSAELCDYYSSRDSRIQVFHTENRGVSHARNYALDRATGEYCVFIDADDLVTPAYIQNLLFAVKTAQTKMAICHFVWGRNETPTAFLQRTFPDPPAFQVIPIERFRYTNEFRHYTVSAGIFSRSLIGDLRFDSHFTVGEDLLMFSRLLRKAGSFAYLDEYYYYATERPDSATHANYNKKQFSEITAWEVVCCEAANSGLSSDFVNECYVALSFRIRNHYEAALLTNYEDPHLLSQLIKKAKSVRHYVQNSRERSRGEKIKYSLFLHFPKIFTHLKYRYKPPK